MFIKSSLAEKQKLVSNNSKSLEKVSIRESLLSKFGFTVKPTLKDKLDEALVIVNSWRFSVDEMVSQIRSPNPKSFSELKKKKWTLTADQDMARVNPYFKEDPTFNINCPYCVAAYDLRRRGFDVEADDYHQNATEPDERVNDIFEIYSWWTHKNDSTLLKRILTTPIHKGETEERQFKLDKLYPGYRYFNCSEYSADEIKAKILSQGNGARGHLSAMWLSGGAHSVVYEVLNDEIIIRDCQRNKVLPIDYYINCSQRLYYFRTDNELPTDRILNCVKNKNSDTINPGELGYEFSSINALARRFKTAGFEIYSYENGYKVYLNNKHKNYLLIDSNGSVEYRNGKISNRRN